MTKKTNQEKKQDKVLLERAKERRKLAQEQLATTKKLNKLKKQDDMYLPGPAFEQRMMYQTQDEFWELSRQIDSVNWRMEEIKLEEYLEHIEREVARLLGEVAARD